MTRHQWGLLTLLATGLLLLPAPARASLDHQGSGTSWIPASTPVLANQTMAGRWMLMLHYSVLAGYDDQESLRGSRRFTSVNWVMGMATHPLLGGAVQARAMLSMEPATAAGPLQLPLLLQTGETLDGQPLHDRQHPHDLFMELALQYSRPLVGDVDVDLYAAPSGEPALGPSAFMHRASAMFDPFPPISHHWQDSTHISFPVLTLGLSNPWLNVEGSLFHGREPDENRWDLDLGPLDSWSARVSARPSRDTTLQVSYGFIHSPETLHPAQSQHRLTASASWYRPFEGKGGLAVTAVLGNDLATEVTRSALLEGQVDLDGENVPFGRLEWVQKLSEDLVLPGDPEAIHGVVQAVVGFAHRFSGVRPVVPLIGVAVDLNFVPSELEPFYGTQVPTGFFVYLGLQPPLAAPMHHEMRGM